MLQFIKRFLNTFVYFETASVKDKKFILSFKLNKSSLNETSPLAFKFLTDLISHTLAKIFNALELEGRYPSCLKNARVIPIHKFGSKSDLTSYRLILTLPFIRNSFENFIHCKLHDFF